MTILSVWLISKSGGLVYQKDFSNCPPPPQPMSTTGVLEAERDELSNFCHSKLNTNDYLVMASTFQSLHAISTQLNPISESLGSKSSGIESIEWLGFSGRAFDGSASSESPDVASIPFKMNCFQSPTGIKIVLLCSPRQPQLEFIIKRVYELYSDYVMKNPFHTPEMPVRSDKFDVNLSKFVKQMSTASFF